MGEWRRSGSEWSWRAAALALAAVAAQALAGGAAAAQAQATYFQCAKQRGGEYAEATCATRASTPG